MQQQDSNQGWQIPKNIKVNDDPLLTCLILLSKIYKTPCSAKTLTAGLPLVDNKLTPELFKRAASRANLEAEINEMDIQDISELVLPAVLLLNDGTACILTEIDGENAKIMIDTTGDGVNTVPISKLENLYTGYVIFVKPLFEFTHRARDTLGKRQRNWFWSVFLQSWPVYLEVLVASALINIFALAIPLFIMNVYDRVVPNYAIETMWVLASGVAIVFIFDLLLKSLRAYFIDAAGKRTDVKLSSNIFEHIMGLQMNVRPSSVGAFANTIQSFEIFREFITSTTITVLVDLPFVAIYILVIYLLGGNIALIPLLMIPVVFVVGILLQMPLTKLTRESYQHAAEKQATLIESLSGIEAIKTSGAESSMQNRWEQVVTLSARLGTKLRFVSNSSINFTVLAQQLSSIAIVIFGVYKISEGELTLGALIACTILNGRALAPMAQVAALFTRYYQSVNALKSINNIMQLPTEVSEETRYLHRPNLKGNIQFKNVDFKYSEDGVEILSNINLNIKAGERVAIIGRIGSGKSTIAKLILGLYQPTKGSIYVDSTDHNQINPVDLRSQIGYVSQDIVLFYGSIKDNIVLGASHIDDNSVLKAADIAAVSQFTNKHPAGLDMQVGERGSNLSGGQRQTVAIARALVTSPNILIFDEPSTSMDDNTEALIRKNLEAYLDESKTLLLITQKASMLSLVDRIIVVEGGRILADGPKESVLKALKSGVKIQ
jgi:ATP-binding cassette subfamily C protein LapB